MDMSLVSLSLEKRPWARLLDHDDALQFAATLREKGKRLHEEVVKRAVEIESPSGKFRVLDLDSLIEAKQTMNRPHDRLTVTQLRAIKERLKGGI